MHDETTAPSASVSISSGSPLTWALFVRDRFALPSTLSIPALDPPVAPQPVGDVPAQAWDQWWVTLVGREPLSLMPPADSRLAELADAGNEDARWWEHEHVTFEPRYHPGWVSTWLMDHRLAVPVEILLVGVGEIWHAQVSASRFLVSVGFYRAHDRMDALLRQALETQS